LLITTEPVAGMLVVVGDTGVDVDDDVIGVGVAVPETGVRVNGKVGVAVAGTAVGMEEAL
jgi:hypothetical protein